LFFSFLIIFMKIALFSDTHLGYARFEADSYVQAERTLVEASKQADLILCAGDIFDVKIPKLETLKRAVEIFNRATVPVIAIHGNHERRSRDTVNPVQLLAASTNIILLHGQDTVFEKNGQKIQIFGLGSVPEEYAEEALKRTLERFKPVDGALKILLIHQSIKELVAGAGEEELSLEYLETLPFDLIVNGHIHKTITQLDGRFIIPGSTVITQFKKEEMEGKGYFLYDTESRKSEFIPIASRPFFYEELVFAEANETQIREKVRERVEAIKKEKPDALIAIKLEGTLKEGLSGSDISLDAYENVSIDNRLNVESLGAKLERIRDLRTESLSIKELALRELERKTNGKITLFDSSEIFDKLVEGVDEAIAYLEERNKKETATK